ncbi:MAG: M48 family metallopeptidase [Gammaproteobacteria bacterium]
MDFFSRQDKARRSTSILVLYFLLAIFLIVLAINAVVYYAFSEAGVYVSYQDPGNPLPISLNEWLHQPYWLYISLGTMGLIMLGSLLRLFNLRGGGQAVAKMAGGRLLDMDSHDSKEIQYINVVEEMSIASGVPMPSLYVMDNESGINAFVAGFRPTETVMVLTRGALDSLSRDELQAVVGHEFSHILNGDMRINIRLIAILAGILLIGKVGEVVLRGSGRRSRGNNKGAGAVLLLALALFAIGYIGLFFGRLIKAAISRQREFLADASSVQFTRNPKGIAGALYKIQQHSAGTLLNSTNAEDVSHMCFGETVKLHFTSLLATHPPLDVRINAVDPTFLKTQKAKALIQNRNQAAQAVSATAMDAAGISGFADSGRYTSVDAVTASVGNPTPEHLAYAHQLISALPASISEVMHSRQGAVLVIYGLLIAGMDKNIGLNFLKQQKLLHEPAVHLMDDLYKLDRRQRLPVVDMVLPVLKRLDDKEKSDFISNIEQLIRLDNKFTLFEFVLLTLIKQHLDKDAGKVNRIKHYSFRPVLAEIRLLLSVLARSSGQNAEKTSSTFKRVMTTFSIKPETLQAFSEISADKITQALNELNLLSPMLKKSIIDACTDSVLDDGIIMPAEAELLRAISCSLDSPMPPLLPER